MFSFVIGMQKKLFFRISGEILIQIGHPFIAVIMPYKGVQKLTIMNNPKMSQNLRNGSGHYIKT